MRTLLKAMAVVSSLLMVINCGGSDDSTTGGKGDSGVGGNAGAGNAGAGNAGAGNADSGTGGSDA